MNFIKYEKEKAEKDNLKIYYFMTDDCGVCLGILEKMKQQYKDCDINVYLIDIKVHPELRGEYMVFSGPTLLLIKDNKVLFKEGRFINFENLNRILDAIAD